MALTVSNQVLKAKDDFPGEAHHLGITPGFPYSYSFICGAHAEAAWLPTREGASHTQAFQESSKLHSVTPPRRLSHRRALCRACLFHFLLQSQFCRLPGRGREGVVKRGKKTQHTSLAEERDPGTPRERRGAQEVRQPSRFAWSAQHQPPSPVR